MPAFAEQALPTAERQALVAEWKRLEAAPPPRERREIGCLTMIIVVALAIAGPIVLRWLGIQLSHPAKVVLATILALVFLGGAFVGLVLVSGRYAHAYRRADAAVAWLAQHGAGGDPVERRKQAVTLLFHAYCTDGPSTSNTINFDQAKERLGEALPYVIAAERALRVDLQIYPVFTDSKVHLPG